MSRLWPIGPCGVSVLPPQRLDGGLVATYALIETKVVAYAFAMAASTLEKNGHRPLLYPYNIPLRQM